MADRDKWPSSGIILAVGVAVAVGLVALGFALKAILPALGVAVGLAFATATTGLATSGAVAAWVAPVAAAGIGTTGVVLAVHLLVSVGKTAQEKPYEWTLPLLGVAAGVALNLWKDLVDTPESVRLLLGGIAALWIVVAGACYKRPGWRWKCAAVPLYLVPPVILLGLDLRQRGFTPAKVYLGGVSNSTWLVVSAFLLAGVTIAAMERLSRRA
jgi:hypothetical protein